MKRMLRLNLLVCTGVLLIMNSSCTFQKRLYRPGFFVQSNAVKSGRNTEQVTAGEQTTGTTADAAPATGINAGAVESLPVQPETYPGSVTETKKGTAQQTAQQVKKANRKSEKQTRKEIKRLIKKKSSAKDKPVHQYIIGSCVCLALGIIGGLLLLSSIGAATTLSGAAGMLLLGFALIVLGVLGAFGLSAAGLIKLKMGDDATFGGYLLGFIMLGISILLGGGIVLLFAD